MTAQQLVIYFEQSDTQYKKEAIDCHSLLSSPQSQVFSLLKQGRPLASRIFLFNYSACPVLEICHLSEKGDYSYNSSNIPFGQLTRQEAGSDHPVLLDDASASRDAHGVSLFLPINLGNDGLLQNRAVPGARDALRDGCHYVFGGDLLAFPLPLPNLLKINYSSRQNKIMGKYRCQIYAICLKSNRLKVQFQGYIQMIKFIYKSHHSYLQLSRFLLSDLNKKPNLYALLELKPGASAQQIRYNYFKLMGKYQADKTGEGDGLKHSKLLNQAFAILSNEKLKEKYDSQNGYNSQAKFDKNKPQKLNLSKDDELDRDYNEAKRGFGAVLGDKKTRFNEKLMGVAAISMFIGTILLLVNGKSYKKQTLAKSAQTKKEGVI